MYYDIGIFKINLKNILNIDQKNIKNVGIKNIYYPFIFDNGNGKLQKSIGIWNLSVFLYSFKRGIHMSRFLKILNIFTKKPIKVKSLFYIIKLFKFYLESNKNYLQFSFIYFLKKISPISKIESYLNYKLTFLVKKIIFYKENILKILIPVSSLCPCSKIISLYNAHNQRSCITIIMKINKKININNIINLIEKESSSELWTFLKRNDEKYVTEFSYNNPKFIEDLVRNVFYLFLKKKICNYFYIKLENFESIHNHDVYSIIYK